VGAGIGLPQRRGMAKTGPRGGVALTPVEDEHGAVRLPRRWHPRRGGARWWVHPKDTPQCRTEQETRYTPNNCPSNGHASAFSAACRGSKPWRG